MPLPDFDTLTEARSGLPDFDTLEPVKEETSLDPVRPATKALSLPPSPITGLVSGIPQAHAQRQAQEQQKREEEASKSLIGISPEMVPAGTTPATSLLSAVGKTGAGLGQWATSPSGIAQQALTLNPYTAPAIGAKWLYDMAKGVIEEGGNAVQELGNLLADRISRGVISANALPPPPQGTLPGSQEHIQALSEHLVGAGAQLLGVAGLSKHLPAQIKSAYRTAIPKGTPDATQERVQQEGRQPEYQGTTPLRVSPETGGGNRPVTETPVQAQEVVTAATYTDPKTGETTTAPNHIEAAAKQGVEAPKAPEARETKDFGFQVQNVVTGATENVTRSEGTDVAREADQLIEEPKRGNKARSNQIESSTEPGVPLSESAPAKPTEAVASPTVAASTPDELAKYRGEIWVSADPNVYIGVGDTVIQANDRGFGVPEGMKGKITDIGAGHGGNAYPVVTWENGKQYRYEPDSLSDLRKISPEQGTASAAELGGKSPPPAQGLKTERQVEQGVKPAPKAPVTPPPPPQVAKGTEVVPAKSGEVTPAVAKVQAEVHKVARTEGQRPAKEVKSELVSRLEEAHSNAIADNDLTLEQRTALEKAKSTSFTELGNYQYGKRGDAARAKDLADLKSKRNAAAEATGLKQITINIPGDGDFTVWNTKDSIATVLDAAKRIKTSPTKPTIERGRLDAAYYLKRDVADALTVYGTEANAYQKLSGQLARADELGIEPEQAKRIRKLISKLQERIEAPWRKAQGQRKIAEDRVETRSERGLPPLSPDSPEVKALEAAEQVEAREKAKVDAILRTPPPPTTPPSTGEGMAGGIGQGPGGKTYKPSAKPEPTESFEATSLKNAVAELEAAGVGHNLTPAEKHAMAPLWDQAGAILKSDPNAGQRLADDLIANPERGMTDADSALLLRHKVGLMNELNNAAERTHVGDAEARAQADREYMQKSDELKSLLDAVKKRGTQWGREGRWRQAMAYEDYTFATQEGLLRAAKGGLPLTEGERTKLLADIEAYKKNAAEQEALRIKREGEAVELKKEIDNLIKNAPTFDKRILAQAEKIVQGMEKFAKPAADRLRARLANLGTSPDPAIIYDAAVVGSAKIARLGLDLAKFTDDMIRDFGEKLRPMIPQIWAEANKMLESNLAKEPELVKRAVKKQNVAEVKTAVTEKIADKVKRGKLDEVTWYVQKLARVFVQSGIRDREQLIDAVHDTIKDVIPGITRRKTMDAISGYGDFKQLSKDQITVTLRGMKGEMQQLAKLEDMAKGQPPLKSGLERRTPTEAERKLIKEVNDAKNKFQVPVQDPSTQLKSALDTLKTTLTNRIKDLSDRIAKGDFEKRPRRQVALDPEAAKLMAQGVEIQKRFRKARYEAEQAQRSPAKKFVDRYVTGLYNSLRSIAVMGHGTVGMFTHAGGLAWRASTAGIWARNFIRQFPMWAKPAYHEQLIHRLKTDPDYYTWLKAGAKIDPDLMYEDYAKYGKALGKLAAGGQRGFDSLKLARLELNKAQWDKVSDDIKADPEQAQATRKAIAEMNNKATGTSPVFGKVGGADVSTVAHSLFFAPQLYASRWSRVLLDPIKTLATFRDWNKATPAERYIATTRVKHAAEFAAVYVGSLVVNQALLSASGSTQKVNFTDPTKSDWLKFKAHGKIVTADGGLLDPVRLMGQIVYGDLIKARTAQERHLQGTRFEKAIKDVGKYLRSKFNPSLGLVVDASTGQDFSGRAVPFSDEPSKYKSQHRYTWGEWIMSHGPIPLGLGTRIAYEEMQKRGLSKPDAAAILEGAAAASIGMTGVHETEDYSKKP